jgi:hypothetical protein
MRFDLARAALLCAVLAVPAVAADRPAGAVSFAIHVQSHYSADGQMSVEDIARTARDNGIDAVIFNDHALERWEYGIAPLRGLLKKTIERSSVLAAGPEAYLDAIAAAGRKYPGVILIPGVESAPFYHWEGSPFDNNLLLNDWHKHLLIAGLPGPDDYRRLPLAGNDNAGRFDGRLLWPLALLPAGFLAARKSRLAAALLLAAGVIFTANNYPFRTLGFDQYHGDRGELPYQGLINYVNRTAPDTGIVFWAHPEAPNFTAPTAAGPVKVRTVPYPESLLRTDRYTGFGYFQEGDRKAGAPGGIWDDVLLRYIRGDRRSPAWAIAELDYRSEGYNGAYMRMFKNVILMQPEEPRTAAAILGAIRRGRFYALAQPSDTAEIRLADLRLTAGGAVAGIGGHLRGNGIPRLSVSLDSSDGKPHAVTVTVIANGGIRNALRARTPATLSLDLPELTRPSYCRIEIDADTRTRIVTNPVFIE